MGSQDVCYRSAKCSYLWEVLNAWGKHEQRDGYTTYLCYWVLTFISESKGCWCGTCCIIYCTAKHLPWINFSLWNPVRRASIFFSGTWVPLVPNLEAKSYQNKIRVMSKLTGSIFWWHWKHICQLKKVIAFFSHFKTCLGTLETWEKILSHLSDLGQMLKSNHPPESGTLQMEGRVKHGCTVIAIQWHLPAAKAPILFLQYLTIY